MEIYKFIKPLRTNLGGNYQVGDRVYKEGDVYYPIQKGGYPLKENSEFKFVDKLELVEETDKPKEYYTQIVVAYTQEQLDQMKNKNNQ